MLSINQKDHIRSKAFISSTQSKKPILNSTEEALPVHKFSKAEENVQRIHNYFDGITEGKFAESMKFLKSQLLEHLTEEQIDKMSLSNEEIKNLSNQAQLYYL